MNDCDKCLNFNDCKLDKPRKSCAFVNDDMCIWKVLHEGCFIQNPHTKRLFSNEESMQNVYCNTCGRKIMKTI